MIAAAREDAGLALAAAGALAAAVVLAAALRGILRGRPGTTVRAVAASLTLLLFLALALEVRSD